MKLSAQVALAIYLGLGGVAWSAWVVTLAVRKELSPGSGWTERLVLFAGRALIWAGAAVVGAALVGAAAALAVRALT